MRRNGEASLPWVTIAIVLANVVVFTIDVAAGAGPKHSSAQTLIALGGDVPLRTLHGEWWRAISSIFVHDGAHHVFVNMFALMYLRRAEQEYGHAAFAVIYVVAGLGGELASDIHGQVVSVGASGAVFGVIGALAVAMRRSRLDARALRTAWLVAAMFLLFSVMDGLRDPAIDNAAHAGGLITGLAIGALLLLRTADRPSARRTVEVAGIGLASIIVSMFGLAAVRPAPLEGPFIATFLQTERDCDARWIQIVEAFPEDNRLKNAERAERDLIAPWHAMRVNLDAAVPPARLATLYAHLRAYAAAREDDWREFAREERSPNPDQRVEMAIQTRKQMAVDREHDAIVDELERLGYRAEDYMSEYYVR